MHVTVLFTLSLYLSTAAQLEFILELSISLPVGIFLVIVSVHVLVSAVLIYLRPKKSHPARADPDKTRLLKGSSTPSYGSVASVEGMYQKNSKLSTCAMLKLHVGEQTWCLFLLLSTLSFKVYIPIAHEHYENITMLCIVYHHQEYHLQCTVAYNCTRRHCLLLVIWFLDRHFWLTNTGE